MTPALMQIRVASWERQWQAIADNALAALRDGDTVDLIHMDRYPWRNQPESVAKAN